MSLLGELFEKKTPVVDGNLAPSTTIDISSFASKIKKAKEDMNKAMSEAYGKIDGKTISHVALTTGKIMEMIPVFDKIGSVIAGIAKLNIDRVAYNRIKETVLDPIAKLKNTLVFLKKMNEITQEMTKTAIEKITNELIVSTQELEKDAKEIEKDNTELTDDTKNLDAVAESTDKIVVELLKNKIEDDQKDIAEQKEELQKNAENIKTNVEIEKNDLVQLLQTVQSAQVSEATIDNITKKLDEIIDILTPKSTTKNLAYTWRDKIDEMDVIMKTMENEMQSLIMQYSTFIFFVGIGFAKIDASMAPEFLQKVIATEEFKKFVSSPTTETNGTSGIGLTDVGNIGNILARGGGRSKRRHYKSRKLCKNKSKKNRRNHKNTRK